MVGLVDEGGGFGGALTGADLTQLFNQGPGSFVLGAPLSISNAPPTDRQLNTVTLNATISITGSVFDVSVYWGTSAGGTTPGAWYRTNFVGTYVDGLPTDLSLAVTGLAPNTDYYYTFLASNAATNMWAAPSENFQSLGPT